MNNRFFFKKKTQWSFFFMSNMTQNDPGEKMTPAVNNRYDCVHEKRVVMAFDGYKLVLS